MTVEEAENKVTEELSDLKLVLMILGLDGSNEIMKKKLDRWYERIMRQEEDDGTEDA